MAERRRLCCGDSTVPTEAEDFRGDSSETDSEVDPEVGSLTMKLTSNPQ